MTHWAYIFIEDEDATARDGERVERVRGELTTTIVAVPGAEAAVVAARRLADEGVELIELCGGFGLEAAAEVAGAVAGRVPVGLVTYAFESIAGAAAFQRQFAAEPA